ncbi:MAG: hypothetical protein K9H16_01200 [Bacteroidales bacterium]|nr:hypothetical protein [Bacteroidales bacterium]
MTEKELIIQKFVKKFVQKHRIERSILELSSVSKRRKFHDRLNHDWAKILRMELLTRIAKTDDCPEKIQELLQFKDDTLVYVFSCYSEFDHLILPFEEAFHHLYCRGFASIIVNHSVDTFFLDTEFVLHSTTPRFIGRAVL